MKLLYVVGLEHSGTTLISHLLSEHENYIALGEIAAFFSHSHMQRYLDKWGDYDDVSLCSCGSGWHKCELWSDLIHLSGHNSNKGLLEKYKNLFDYFKEHYPPDTVIVDSSKSFSILKLLIDNAHSLGLSHDDVFVVFAAKDVRNFANSIASKEGANNSLVSHYRSFNWWLGENKKIISYLENAEINFQFSFYDVLFNDGDELPSRINSFLRECYSTMGYQTVESSNVSHSKSPIAMGNKNFIMRNRNNIRYDERWRKSLNLKLVYALHNKAQSFNQFLYQRFQSI